VEIGAVYNSSFKPQPCQKQKNNYSSGLAYALLAYNRSRLSCRPYAVVVAGIIGGAKIAKKNFLGVRLLKDSSLGG